MFLNATERLFLDQLLFDSDFNVCNMWTIFWDEMVQGFANPGLGLKGVSTSQKLVGGERKFKNRCSHPN